MVKRKRFQIHLTLKIVLILARYLLYILFSIPLQNKNQIKLNLSGCRTKIEANKMCMSSLDGKFWLYKLALAVNKFSTWKVQEFAHPKFEFVQIPALTKQRICTACGFLHFASARIYMNTLSQQRSWHVNSKQM